MAKLSSYTTVTTVGSSDFLFLTNSGVNNSRILWPNFSSGIFPSQTSQSGKILATNGTGILWVASGGGGGGTPGGSDKQIQYNFSGAFGGSNLLSYDYSLPAPILSVSGSGLFNWLRAYSGIQTPSSGSIDIGSIGNPFGSGYFNYQRFVRISGVGLADISGGSLSLVTPLGLIYGGHGTSTASGAINTIVPSQAGNSGLFLTTNGVVVSWSGGLPSQTSQSGKILATNGTGALWVASGGGSSSPGGSNSNIQYNSSGAFGGSSNLVFDYSGNQLGINTNIPQAPFHVKGPGYAAQMIIQDSLNTGVSSQHLVSFYDSAMTRQFYIFKSNTGSIAWNNEQSQPISFAVGGNTKLTLDAGTNTTHTHLSPSATNTHDLGNVNAVYRNSYTQFVNCSGININAEITGALIPDSNKSRNIGSTIKNWGSGYLDFINISSVNIVNEITGNILPEANKTRNVGSTVKNYATGFFDNLTVNRLVINTTASGAGFVWPMSYGWSFPSGTVSGSGINMSYEIPILMDCTVQSGGYAQIRSKNTPSGGASGFVIDINYNGTSIWSATQANRLRIASGAVTGSQASFDNTGILARGGYLTIDFDVVGSAIYPQDVVVELLTMAQK